MSDVDSDSPPRDAHPSERLEPLDGDVRTPSAPQVADVAPVFARASSPAAVPAPRLTRRGRLRKWDRPKPPKDWRFWVGNLGKTLIATGLLMFGFVAYQLWGTGIETARAQNQLENEFDALLAEAPPVTAPVVVTPDVVEPPPADPDAVAPDVTPPDDTEVAPPATDATATDGTTTDGTTTDGTTTDGTAALPVPVEAQNIPELEDGDALARIEIPAIGVNDIVVAGVSTTDLKKGPGHFPDTPLPGQLGNSAIAGHRTTYGQPFHDVDKLEVGDQIVLTTLNGVFTYRVTGQQIVSPNDYQVVATTDPTRATLTLTSCHPKLTAQKRIVIFSELEIEASAPVGEPVINYGRPPEVVVEDPVLPADDADIDAPVVGGGSVSGNLDDPAPGAGSDADLLGTDAVNEGIADAFSEGWFSDPGANSQVGLWGLLLSAIAIGAYQLSRKLRRDWAGALVGIMPFVVTLYFFFQNVNRLLPPNL